jgi:hypothetical protein
MNLTPQDLKRAFLDGIAVGSLHVDADGYLKPPHSRRATFTFDELGMRPGIRGLYEQLADQRFPEQPIRIPKLVRYAGREYGWVGDALYARREIDRDLEPTLTGTLPTNGELLSMLVEIKDRTELVPHDPESVLWANLY